MLDVSFSLALLKGFLPCSGCRALEIRAVDLR